MFGNGHMFPITVLTVQLTFFYIKGTSSSIIRCIHPTLENVKTKLIIWLMPLLINLFSDSFAITSLSSTANIRLGSRIPLS